jgi:hypothetical protein
VAAFLAKHPQAAHVGLVVYPGDEVVALHRNVRGGELVSIGGIVASVRSVETKKACQPIEAGMPGKSPVLIYKESLRNNLFIFAQFVTAPCVVSDNQTTILFFTTACW